MDARQSKREAFELAEQQRKAAGQEEAAANQAISEARNKALVEGLAAVAGPAVEAGVVIEREGKALVARHEGSIPCCSATAWLERLLK
jgi:hypothetical protein